MRTGWQKKTLSEVCIIRPPKSEARINVAPDALVSFAPMEDLGIDRKLLSPSQVKPLSSVAGSYTYFAEGDVLLAKITPCFENGKLGIATKLTNGIGFGSSEFIVLRPCADLDNAFLYYYLSRADFRNEGAAQMGGAVGQQRVPKEFIEKYPIVMPPLPEQRRIVGILDKAFEAIANAKAIAERNVGNCQKVFENHLELVFTQKCGSWHKTQLGEAYDVRDGTHVSPKYHASGYPLVTSKNLKRSGLSFEGVSLISEEDYRKINQRSAVHRGDVLFAMIGTIGNPTLVLVEPRFAIKNVALFKIPQGQDGAFLRYYLSSRDVLSKMMAEAKGTTQKFVGLGYLRDFQIAIPTLSRQREIVAELDALSAETQRLEAIYRQKVTALGALKKSFLHHAFTGQL